MAGPVSTYITTQTAAQTAFTVPFGLLTLVNGAIATATAAGLFNTTVDCSLFVTEDVSNLRIYLDSLGYKVDFAKNTGEKSLNIDWSKFLDDANDATTVYQGTTPWVISGTVTVSNFPPLSTTATTTAVVVTTSPTLLLAANGSRKGFVVQTTTGIIFVKLDTTSSTSLYGYELPRKAILEKDNYNGAVAAVTASGSTTVYVTELT